MTELISKRLFIAGGLVLVSRLPVYAAGDVENMIFALTNQQRGSAGLRVLKRSRALDKAALKHAKDMAKYDILSHSVKGSTVPGRVKRAGYGKFKYLAENIANYPVKASAEKQAHELIKLWINSPAHRINIFSNKARDIGIGVASNSKWVYATQNFGTTK